MGHRVRVAEIVCRDDLESVVAFQRGAEEVAADASEAVDGHPSLCHRRGTLAIRVGLGGGNVARRPRGVRPGVSRR